MLYGTTKKFLQVFGLRSLKDLPQAEQLKPPKQIRPREPSADSAEKGAGDGTAPLMSLYRITAAASRMGRP